MMRERRRKLDNNEEVGRQAHGQGSVQTETLRCDKTEAGRHCETPVGQIDVGARSRDRRSHSVSRHTTVVICRGRRRWMVSGKRSVDSLSLLKLEDVSKPTRKKTKKG